MRPRALGSRQRRGRAAPHRARVCRQRFGGPAGFTMRLAASFVASAEELSSCPRWERTEVALAGRSNVGKSSLLNAIAANRRLARTSRTPGRTRALNFFALGQCLALVDLPGFGYAKMARDRAQALSRLLSDYLEGRANLAALLLLVDLRRGPERDEAELVRLARRRGLRLMIAATKADKLSSNEQRRALEGFTVLSAEVMPCSARTGSGIQELRRWILGFGGPGISQAI